MADIKAYRPASSSISSGQVLQCPYPVAKAHLVACEMAEQLAMDLFEKHLTTDQLVLTVGYDKTARPADTHGIVVTFDRYGRAVPKHAHGTANLPQATSSITMIVDALSDLYQRIVNPDFTVRRLTLCANHVLPEDTLAMHGVLPASRLPQNTGSAVPAEHAQSAQAAAAFAGQGPEQEQQLDLFGFVADGKDIFGRDAAELQRQKKEAAAAIANERRIQQSLLAIKQKFGKNAIIKGRDLEDGATAMQRNEQIGGHKA